MNSFFYVHFNEKDNGGLAFSIGVPDRAMISLKSIQCGELSFKLMNGEVQDYLANDLGLPLMSEKLKGLLNEFEVNKNMIWKQVFVIVEGSRISYFMPCPSYSIDVIDTQKTIFIDGPLGKRILKAYLSREKIQSLNYFPISESDITWIVSDRVRKKIRQMKVSGIDFTQAQVI